MSYNILLFNHIVFCYRGSKFFRKVSNDLTRLHVVIFQQTVIFTLTVTRTLDLSQLLYSIKNETVKKKHVGLILYSLLL
jgi:hypothetical protein